MSMNRCPIKGKPVSFNQVWQMFQETDRMLKETDKKLKKSDKMLTEKFKESDRKIDKLAKLYGGLFENSKDVAEKFFRRGLEARSSIFGIEYTEVDHLARTSKKTAGRIRYCPSQRGIRHDH